MSAADIDIDRALRLLSENPNYRVLERLPDAANISHELDGELVTGIALDVETTGLDADVDEVIELGMIKFTFSRAGSIGRVLETFRSLNQPSNPISHEITALTGLRDADVKDQRIDVASVERFIEGAALFIAHNAAFDRPFCEKIIPSFSEVSWACSATEIDWRAEGISGSRLEYIANSFGRFYDAHQAVGDCNALINILSFALPRSKKQALSMLLETARRTEVRIFAEGAPYDLRIELKKRAYRWNDGQNGYPRAWWKDVRPETVEAEIEMLTRLTDRNVINPLTFQMTAKTRFRRRP